MWAFSILSVSLLAGLLDAKFNNKFDEISKKAEIEFNLMFAETLLDSKHLPRVPVPFNPLNLPYLVVRDAWRAWMRRRRPRAALSPQQPGGGRGGGNGGEAAHGPPRTSVGGGGTTEAPAAASVSNTSSPPAAAPEVGESVVGTRATGFLHSVANGNKDVARAFKKIQTRWWDWKTQDEQVRTAPVSRVALHANACRTVRFLIIGENIHSTIAGHSSFGRSVCMLFASARIGTERLIFPFSSIAQKKTQSAVLDRLEDRLENIETMLERMMAFNGSAGLHILLGTDSQVAAGRGGISKRDEHCSAQRRTTGSDYYS